MGAYRLVRGGRDLGRVTIDYVDMWYFAGRFSEPTSEFAAVKHLFEEYWAAEGDSSRAVWQEIIEPGICGSETSAKISGR